VGSGLQGVTYVLDEPSIGLHPRDNQRLLAAMKRLRDRGNSVLVVEHDAETMLAADHIVEVGPGAGREGGKVLAAGPPGRFLRSKCVTAAFLRGERVIPLPEARRAVDGPAIVVKGAHLNNLHDVDARVPLGTLTVVTGVSGSGKSSLVFGALEPSVSRSVNRKGGAVGCASIDGIGEIDKVVRISQRPIGRTPRSNPATYTGAMNIIRDLFAATEEARARGYTKSRFSFNVKGGRCEECQGAGVKTVEMQFLPDVQVPCEACGGRRFNRETLDIRYKGMTIADVLELPAAEALEHFSAIPALARILGTIVDVGLDYVRLGQPSTTLSGGEAQRMKLASELQRPSTGKTLYLLDEPTTGLHFQDVDKLIRAMQRLVDLGNTVLVVEHHTDIIKCADHVIDLGPDGGDGGGRIVGSGTPEHIATLDTPTGRALAVLPELTGAALPVAAERRPRRLKGRARPKSIAIRGARKHNLQGVDVELPHGAMSVVTGVSGSGKTSLAFDTIFAEGQRRYVESLSTYARRFLGQVERAPLDRIEGLQPAIAIDQANASHNPRSTVATVTEIHDVLRLLYARVGTPHCPHCDKVLEASSPSVVARKLRELDPGAGWLTTDLPPDAEAEERRTLLLRDGWRRILVAGDKPLEIDLEDDAALPRIAEGAELVLDRFSPGRTAGERVAEAVGHAYRMGAGRARFLARRSGDSHRFTEGIVCPDHGPIFSELTPRHFSFNARQGMCPRCEGVGTVTEARPERVLGEHGPLWDALDPRVTALLEQSPRTIALIEALLRRHRRTREDDVLDWTESLRHAFMRGDPKALEVTWSRGKRTREETLKWPGLLEMLRKAKLEVAWVTAEVPCPVCRGGRLGPSSLAVRLQGMNIATFSAMTVGEASETASGWSFGGEAAVIAERPLDELQRRLSFLVDVGLSYLPLSRRATTLSGGESQRIRLASQLGSGLTGVTYVLDEPTIGLHPRDTDRLLGSIRGLRDLGNTVVVVEHDPDTIDVADYVVDMGPAAGRFGGHVIAAGTPAEIREDPSSVTGRWLSGTESVPLRASPRTPTGMVRLEAPSLHNLRLDRVAVPLGVWTAVTGVSGSGKSSLIMETLAPALVTHCGGQAAPGPYKRFEVDGTVDGVVLVDQAPIGRSPRSTPATYTGILDHLRKLFAQTPGARERGWKPGRFSFNAEAGRCEACEGRGAVLVEMHFLPDVWVTCSTCKGRRYKRDTLEVRFKGHSIADVLAMRCDEALEVFQRQRAIRSRLQALVDVGLGYMTLGQPSTTLSGGEAQRVKLASELVSRKGTKVYVLDEPTTGLHLADVAKLVQVLHRLVDKGHTVITIEHHLEMIRQADHVLELGPEGGSGGGQLVGEGTPASLMAGQTATGVALARM
jgi:excinuclease ABC subunit A